MNFSFTYSDIITTVATWIVNNCSNIDNYDNIDICFKTGYVSTHIYADDEWYAGGEYVTLPHRRININWPTSRSDYSGDMTSVYYKPFDCSTQWPTPKVSIQISANTEISRSFDTQAHISDHITDWIIHHFDYTQSVCVNGLLTFSELIIFYIKNTIKYRVSYLSDNWYLEYHSVDISDNPTNIYTDADVHDDLIRLFQTIEHDPSKLGMLEYIFKSIIHTIIKYLPVENVKYTFIFDMTPPPPTPPEPTLPTDIHVDYCAVSAVYESCYVLDPATERQRISSWYEDMQRMDALASFTSTIDSDEAIINVTRTDLDTSKYKFKSWAFNDDWDKAAQQPVSPGYIIDDSENPARIQFQQNGTTYISCVYVEK